jgi:hypothetical protein
MKIFSSFLLLIVMSTAFLSCKKDSSTTEQPTKAQLISASGWTYQDGGIDGNGDGAVDAGASFSVLFPTLVPVCRTDNVFTFKADNTGTVDEGATKCNAADPQTTSFNWSFTDNESAINISNNVFAIFNGKSNIRALTDTKLSLTRDTTVAGTTYTLLVVLKH